jgi:putative FmdB family regulatory protein
MPLYEYRCNACGEFEAWRSMAEYNAPINCSECNQVATKIFSAPNINLNSGSLSAIARSQAAEPRLVKQEPKEPNKPRYQTSSSNRPWMVSHAPTRF